MKRLKHWLHRIRHHLGLNMGEVVVWTDHRNKLIVAFKCDSCGEVEGEHEANFL